MKKLYFIILLVMLARESISQDTSIVKYFPLAIGNMWVYQRTQGSPFPPGPGFDIVRTDSSFIYNNHKYYVLRTYSYLTNGSLLYISPKSYRVDSLNGNLYSINVNECLVDSLYSRRNDSAWSTCIVYWMVCYDTITYSIFGLNPKTKAFQWVSFEQSELRRCAKNFGIVYRSNYEVTHLTQRFLLGCVINGILYGDTNTFVGIHQINSQVPDKFSLSQNYPNPFNPLTNIKFQMPKSGFVKVIIFDVLGKEVQTLVNQQLSPGTYEADFDGSNLPSGVYYYQLTISNEQLSILFNETKKMVLVK